MRSELVSKKTRYEFREFLVGWILREIEMTFDGVDVEYVDLAPDKLPSGQRRSLVECYYASIDWSDWSDVSKILKAYETILVTLEEDSPEQVQRLSKWLERDGYQYRDGRITSKVGLPHSETLAEVAVRFGASELARQIQRVNDAVWDDPGLAIGTAKELVETTCRTILSERGEAIEGTPDLPALVKQTAKVLQLLPRDVPSWAKGRDTIKRLLSNLATVARNLSELRNWYGTGHGREGRVKALDARHAKLAAGAATTLAVFLFDTHQADLRAANQARTISSHMDSSQRRPPVQFPLEDRAGPGETS